MASIRATRDQLRNDGLRYSNSSIGTSSASFPTIAFATFQTCIRLSSAALHSTHGSFMFQLKSAMRFVWPPCMKRLQNLVTSPNQPLDGFGNTYSSGGPSSASSGVCSSPTRLRSQNIMRRSELELPRMASSNGCHARDVTESL